MKILALTFAIAACQLFSCFSANCLAVQTASTISDSKKSDMAGHWSQWRGPNRDGAFSGATLPEKLDSENLSTMWRKEMGPSYSGPIVTDDLVFVTETKDSAYEVVSALNRKSGEVVWQTQWAGAMKVPMFARANGSWIRATPAYDDGRLYVGGIRDVLVCLNANDGSEIWKLDFPAATGSKNPDFGFSSSPMVHGDAIYVQAGGAFYKLNKTDGSVIWKTLGDGGGMMGSAFASPTIATIHDTEQLLVQTRSHLNGVDIQTGTVLWSQKVPSFRGMNILTPIVFGNQVFTSSYQNRSYLYSISKTGDSWSVETSWEVNKPAYMSTPIEKDGYIYMHLQNQRFTCLDLETGESKWTSPTFGKYSSLIVQGDKVLALDQRGELILFRAKPEEFELLSQTRVSDQETWAHLGAADNHLFVRELNAISAFEFGSE